MDRVRRTDVDSTDEQAKVFNRIIDNLNQLEGKVLQMLSIKKPMEKPVAKKKKGAKNA